MIEESEIRTIDLDFVIIGGGILGTAVAALAGQMDYRALVLRLDDDGVPRADTLRNQGWLQSGIVYRLRDFSSEAEYRNVASATYFGGRDMLTACEMVQSSERAILRAVKPERIAETEKKAKLLRLGESEFRRLDKSEALDRLGNLHEPGSVYFQLPDSPFDEAAVLRYLRAAAIPRWTVENRQFIDRAKPAIN